LTVSAYPAYSTAGKMNTCRIAPFALALLALGAGAADSPPPRFYVELTLKEPARVPNTPSELVLNFQEYLEKLGVGGEFDRHSVSVEALNPKTGRFEPADFRLDEQFKYSDSGRLLWLIRDPSMTVFRVGFDVAARPPRRPPDYVPAIGAGDELMFNTGEPAPLVAMSAPLLADLTGDGITDVLAINHYSDRFGWPEDGILLQPGIREDDGGLAVRDYFRLHFVPEGGGASDLRPLHARYNWVWPVDWDADGLTDLLYISMAQGATGPNALPENRDLFASPGYITFLKNTGTKLAGEAPLFMEAGRYPAAELTEKAYVPSLACADLDGDGRADLVGVRTSPDGAVRTVSLYFYRNSGAGAGLLPGLDPPALLKAADGRPVSATQNAHLVSLGDMDGDGRPDIIGNELSPSQVYWFRNLGGSPPRFGERTRAAGLLEDLKGYRWVSWKAGQGLIGLQSSRLFARKLREKGPAFEPAGRLMEVSGPLRGGLQEKPEWVDSDEDGDPDLLAGEFAGTIHLYENAGAPGRPKFLPPVPVAAAGRPIRITRDGVFGGKHWHGMAGYPSVACADWDGDALFDLIVPNETNRVFWYRNIGRRGSPAFGERRQILPDGFVDSAERLEKTRRLAEDPGVRNHPYPLEPDIPFFWRTRLAIADYTGDGLTDLMALDGMKNLVLYRRYRSERGELRLGRGEAVVDNLGKPILSPHFFKLRDVDWDGDGLVDIIATQNLFGPDQRSLLFLRNVGTKAKTAFARPEAIQLWGQDIRYSSHGLQPSLLDFDGDGSLDFVGCTESGLYVLFRRAALTGPKPVAVASEPRIHQRDP